MHIFGQVIEISFGVHQFCMSSKGSVMLFIDLSEIINVREEKNGPSYIISVA
jgi:hypothetical protein